MKQKTGNKEKKNITQEKKTNPAKIHDAIVYASIKHSGQWETVTGINYVCHSMAVMDVLTSMGADDDLKIAGLLHDVPNKTDTTIFDIAQRYGNGVAQLLTFSDENLTASWQERTDEAVAKLNFADKRAQMLILADKVVLQRSLVAAVKAIGDEVWANMNTTRDEMCCYLSQIQDSLKEMQNYPDTEDIYWEMVTTFKDLFVDFWATEAMDKIYQVAPAGSYMIEKSEPKWVDFEGELPEGLVKVTRQQSEQMEAEWLTFYIIHIEGKDLKDGMYEIYEGGSNKRTLTISVSGRKIQMICCDEGVFVDEVGIEREHRFYYELGRKESSVFAKMLRSQYGAGEDFATILKDAFGHYDGPIKFKAFCEAFNLGYVFCTDKR